MPAGAVREVSRTIGRVACSCPVPPRLTLVSGILNEGEVQAPAVIRAAKMLAQGHLLILYDASPGGIACPVIETLEGGSDACILVTESTPPFGLHDLRLAAEVVDRIGIPAGVVINRSDGRDEETLDFCRERGLPPVIMTIPFSREIAAVQNRGGGLIAALLPGGRSGSPASLKRWRRLRGG
ncbi:hypothetical protein [Methanoculleus chikugoensis]|uniref:hypothetical protein n=1 Tax=Methanoculleus chikugoensis TaxID=118126 RepID=UPI000A795DA3|nr:hypothetical protein [Methanoculleus chikugoensis]